MWKRRLSTSASVNYKRCHWPWRISSWKGWLYLLVLVFISGRLFVGHGFSLTLTPPAGKADSAVGGVPNSAESPKHGDRGLKMALGSSTWSSQLPVENETENLDGSPVAHQAVDDNVIPMIIESKKNTNDEKEGDRVKELEYRYWLRTERIKQVCRDRRVLSTPIIFTMGLNETRTTGSTRPKVPMNVESPVTSHFSLVPTFQTMGCFLNKVASSSLVSAFLLVHGLGPTFTSPHSLAPHLFPRSLEDFQFANQTFFKFMMVRHPMDRMLSCYIDKMVKSTHFSLPPFRGYVISKAREIKQMRKKAKKPDVNLMQSASHVPQRRLLSSQGWTQPDPTIVYGRPVEEGKRNNEPEEIEPKDLQRHAAAQPKPPVISKPDVSPLNRTRVERKPTFEEFLEFVLDTDLQGFGYDAHWVPYHRYCTPCSVPYHVIGKLETASEDFQYIWSKTGLNTQVPVPWINRNTVPSKSKTDLEKKYYSSLPRELILRFYDAFRMDFEMFDYSINDILIKAGYETIDEHANEILT